MSDEQELELLLEEYDELMQSVPHDVRRRWWLIIPTLLEATAQYTWSSDKSIYELEAHAHIWTAVISTQEEFERVGRWWIANRERYNKAMGIDVSM